MAHLPDQLRIEAGLSVVQMPHSSSVEIIKRCIAERNFTDAVRLAELELSKHLGDIELRYLLAHALQASGHLQRAMEEWRVLIQDSRARALSILPLAGCLWKSGLLKEAIRLLEASASDDTTSSDLLCSIGEMLLDMGEESAGTAVVSRVIKSQPENPKPVLLLARYYQGANLTVGTAIKILTAAAEHWPDHAELNAMLANCYARYAKYDRAIYFLTKSIKQNGTGDSAAWSLGAIGDQSELALWMRFLGDERNAQATLSKILGRIDQVLCDDSLSKSVRVEWSATKGRLHFLLGQIADAHHCYKDVRKIYGDVPYVYRARSSVPPTPSSAHSYLPHTAGRLGRMQNLVGGRDVFIFCYGPSIEAMDKRWRTFARAGACLIAVNRSAVFEKGFLAQTQTNLDAVILSHYNAFRSQMSSVLEFLSRPEENLLITNMHSIERMGPDAPSHVNFEKAFDQRLLYFGEANRLTPATPYSPLRYTPVNTLAILLALTMIARPRRIFLFGADGGTAQPTEPIYYRENHNDFLSVLNKFERSLFATAHSADTARFNAFAEMDLIATEHLFDVPRPPIYNVSPTSAIKLFPRISYERAHNLLFSGADTVIQSS